MPIVVGVQFKPVSKIYYFDPDGCLDLTPDDYVIVDTAKGSEVVQIVQPPHTVTDAEIVGEMKKVVRRATAWDLVQQDQWQHKEAEAAAVCREKAREHGLPMKISRCEYNYDGGRLTVFFTADHRVDFRSLVRDLARVIRVRIEMRQVGVRDEAKLLDGVGKCGRQLCCTSWLREFTPVSIRMAKNQQLPLNPDEISGVCGRLLCCLSYESDTYREQNKKMPKVGAEVVTPQGGGRVRHVHPLKETITVLLETGVMAEFSIDELISSKKSGGSCGTCGGCTVKRRASAEEENAQARAKQAAPGETDTQSAQDGERKGGPGKPRRRRRPRNRPDGEQ
jgi:cell fate regulator YaaT (PSP1 superfamily)